MSDEDFTSILQDTRGDEMRSATFSIDGVVMANVGVRPSGESSRVPGNQKMSMRVEFDAFDDGKRMGGVDEIKLSGSWDDPFIVRDRLAYWFYRQVMPAPREIAAQLLDQRPAARRLRDRGGLGQGGARVALRGPERPALPHARASPTRTRTSTRGRIRRRTCRCPGIRWDGRCPTRQTRSSAAALQVVAEDPAGIGEVMDVDTLLTYFAGQRHRCPTPTASRGRSRSTITSSTSIRRPGASSSCRGIPTTPSDRSTTCPTPTSS